LPITITFPELSAISARDKVLTNILKSKKLLVEGRLISLLTSGTTNSSTSVIPEGLYHVFIGGLAQRTVWGHRVNHYRDIPLLICRGLVTDVDYRLGRSSGIGIALGIKPDIRDPVIRDGRFIEYCTGTSDDIPDILVHAE